MPGTPPRCRAGVPGYRRLPNMTDAPLASPNGPMSPPRRKNRAWIWYFVLLAILSVTATTILIVYNLGQQLTPQKLEVAYHVWKERGPASYDMEYTTQTNTPAVSTFHVQVRDHNVVEATLDGRPIEPRLYSQRSMEGLFSDLKRFLEIDQKPGSPRSFARASFDPEDGHITRYTRSVSATRQRVEIIVTKFEPMKK